MDIVFRILIILLISIPAQAAFTPITVDGQATGKYMRTEIYTALQTQLARIDSSLPNTLQTTSPSASGGKYIAASSTISGSTVTPKISSKLQIPTGAAAGAAVTAVLTAPVTKAGLATAVNAMVRFNPYLATAMTLGWLANAGYQMITDNGMPTGTMTGSIGQPTSLTKTLISNLCHQSSNYYGSSPTAVCSQMGGTTYQWNGGLNIYNVDTNGAMQYHCSLTNNNTGATINSAAVCDSGYDTQCASPYSWDANKSVCTNPTGGSVVPVADATVISKLATTPYSGSADTVNSANDIVNNAIKNGYAPDTSSTPTLTGPNGETTITNPGGKETTTTPDGTVKEIIKNYQTDFVGDTAQIKEITTETVTPPSGTPQVTTTTQPAQIDTTTANSQVPPEPAKTDCDKYPDSVGCSKFGTAPTADTLTTNNVSMSLNPISLGTGSCPTPQVLNLQGQPDITLSYQPYCNFATSISPLVVAFAWLSAGFIVMGAVRE